MVGPVGRERDPGELRAGLVRPTTLPGRGCHRSGEGPSWPSHQRAGVRLQADAPDVDADVSLCRVATQEQP
jgi:hypothetical protein